MSLHDIAGNRKINIEEEQMKAIKFIGVAVAIIGIYALSGYDMLMDAQKVGLIVFSVGLILSVIGR